MKYTHQLKNRMKSWDMLLISNTLKHKDIEQYESKRIENYIQANTNKKKTDKAKL